MFGTGALCDVKVEMCQETVASDFIFGALVVARQTGGGLSMWLAAGVKSTVQSTENRR